MRRLASLLICPALLAGCAAGNDTIKAVTDKVSSPGDKAPVITVLAAGPYEPSGLARGAEKDMAQQRSFGAGFVHADALENYLQGLRAKLLGASGVTGVPGRVRITAEGGLVASSSADGNVYIAMGWFENIDSEDEIAALLAHELSHVLRHHHSSDQVSNTQKQLQSLLTYGAEAQKTAGQVAAQLPGGNVPSSKGKRGTADLLNTDKTDRTLHRVRVSITLTDKALLPAWSRSQEREADLLGIDLLVKAGYNPGAMVAILAKVKATEPAQADEQKQRESQLNDAMAEAQKGNWGEMAKKATADRIASLSASHPSTDARIEEASAYQNKYYADRKTVPLNAAGWRRAEDEKTTRLILFNYGKSLSAEQMLGKGDPKVAYALAKQGAAGVTAHESYPNWVASLAAQVNNAPIDARRFATAAVNAPEPVNAAFEAYVAQLESEGRPKQALVEAEKAGALFGDVSTWKVTRIRLLRKSGDAQGAKSLEMECNLQTPDFKSQCNEAGNTPLGKPGK